MLEVRVEHLGDVQFTMKARQHVVYCDQPENAGGYDEGMTPLEFFLGSLGTCAAYYAAQYLKTRSLSTTGLVIRVTAEKVKSPARLDDLKIYVEYPQPIDDRHREGMLKAVQGCVIHNTIQSAPHIETQIQAPVLASTT
jgi:putative redox protein